MGDEVKTKSSYETVKPSSPTPSHLKNFKFDLFDSIMPPLPSCILLLYSAKEEITPPDHAHIATILKTSLSETLCQFYPLAGRFGDFSVDCNDQGIPFVENHVSFSLSTLLSSFPNPDLLSKLYPPLELLKNGVLIAIQFTVFSCGGFAISRYDSHKILDGSSAATFFKHWAAVSRNRYKGQDEQSTNIVQPNFDAALAAFPPSPRPEKLKMAPMPLKVAPGQQRAPDPLVVTKAFIFLDTAISELKTKAVSKQVPNPSRFESVGSFILKQLLLVASPKPTAEPSDKEGLTAIVLTADMRPRADPPLPRDCMGYLTHIMTTWADKQAEIPELVTVIREAISSSKDKIREFQGENRVEAFTDNWKKVFHIVSNYKENTYHLMSWSKVGNEEIDYGFGKPTWVVPIDGRTNPSQRNSILLKDYAGPDGIGFEAWLSLEEDVMQRLLSNQDFLGFAYPKF